MAQKRAFYHFLSSANIQGVFFPPDRTSHGTSFHSVGRGGGRFFLPSRNSTATVAQQARPRRPVAPGLGRRGRRSRPLPWLFFSNSPLGLDALPAMSSVNIPKRSRTSDFRTTGGFPLTSKIGPNFCLEVSSVIYHITLAKVLNRLNSNHVFSLKCPQYAGLRKSWPPNMPAVFRSNPSRYTGIHTWELSFHILLSKVSL